MAEAIQQPGSAQPRPSSRSFAPKIWLSTTAPAGFWGGHADASMRWRECRCPCRQERRSALSASRAVASRRLARAIVRLVEPTAGRIIVGGVDIAHLGRRALRRYRRELQMVFQDPYGSLNPRLPISEIIAEPLKIHGSTASGRARARRRGDALVGLTSEYAKRYPTPALRWAAPASRDRTLARPEPKGPHPR